MAHRHIDRGGSLPHARYGIDLSNVPDTYINPFVAYRVWNWTAEGLTSLNRKPWTAKVAFEARCHYADDLHSMKAAAPKTKAAKEFWNRHCHHVPDVTCTCGMYAGINMQHMIDIGYVQRGIHGEVHLWGRLLRHELGWRAQYAYPKYFVIPVNMIPYKAEQAQERLAALIEFDVDIYLQPERKALAGQTNIPLWIRDYGYSTQGTEYLVERWSKWDSTKIEHALKVGDRIAVFSEINGGGIGVVKEISGEDVHYTLFNPKVICQKKLEHVHWNERNWRWETNGLGSMRKLDHAMTAGKQRKVTGREGRS